MEELLEAIARSEPEDAATAFDGVIARGADPWVVHLALFPIAQRVLNPPYINPHLPKMHAICREFLPFLRKEDIAALVRLEVREYARRPKLDPLPAPGPLDGPAPFSAIEAAVAAGDRQAAAGAMAGYASERGHRELARRLALLGSGYLDRTLGHALSCSTFILQEMLEGGHDPWPALTCLADYFVKGALAKTVPWDETRFPASEDARFAQVLKAVSGAGIVDLHHTITHYAAERASLWCDEAEARHLLSAAAGFMADKAAAPLAFRAAGTAPADYGAFSRVFVAADATALVAEVSPMLGSEEGRRSLGGFLIRGVCDAYQGDYDPHFLTGLGSLLWVLERFRERRDIQQNALFQYAAYFFDGLRRRR